MMLGLKHKLLHDLLVEVRALRQELKDDLRFKAAAIDLDYKYQKAKDWYREYCVAPERDQGKDTVYPWESKL